MARDTASSARLGLRGPHNARNASVARAVLAGLGIPAASDPAQLAEAGVDFAGLPSRCCSLGSVHGVEFVDDSLATNVLPTRAAAEAFADRPVALLVGGHDRGVDYGPLGESVATRTQTLVVTMPDNGPRIGAAVRHATDHVEVIDAASLDDAVEAAYAWAGPGAWYCSRPWRRASGASTTTAPAPEPSPRRRPVAGPSAETAQQRAAAGASLLVFDEEEPPRVGRDEGGGLDHVGVRPEVGERLHLDHPAARSPAVRCTSQKRVPSPSNP